MAYKDTLTLYEELVSTGTPEAQAKITAHQMGDLGDIMMEIRKDLMWMRIIGIGMITLFAANFFR